MGDSLLSFDDNALDPDIRNSLLGVAETMSLAQDDWCLIGGAGYLLHGLKQHALSDIDVVLSVADADMLSERLQIRPQAKSPHPSFRSKRFLLWEELPISAEFMAGFDVLHDGEWVNIYPSNCLEVPLGKHSLRVPNFEDFTAICRMFGRPKDLQRLEQLAAIKASD